MAKVYMSDPAIPIIKRNESAAMRFSSYIRNSRSKTVFQGQPTYLSVRNITFTTANFFFKYVGTPLYYEISLADGADSRVFYVDHSVFVSAGSVKLESLRPSNTYTVSVVAHYVSDDKYSGNQTISFKTLLAQGAVSDITATNPINQKYIVDSNNFIGTSFDISFVPLIDNVRYELILSLDNNTGQEPVINIIQPTVINVSKLPFNTRVDISVNSIYGESNSIYKYSKKITHQTLNESEKSKLSIAKVYNKSVDLSYDNTYVPNVVYSLYINDVSTVSHKEYIGVFDVSDLSIDHPYGNTYVSVTYPESGNEYKNLVSDISFTTLNEENSHIISGNTIIKNTEIIVECTNPIGDWKNIYFLKDGVQSDLSNTFRHVFSDLSINTSYDISVETVYKNNNTYIETQRLTTLHEGPIKGCMVSHPDIYTTSLNFTPSPNQADISAVTYTYSNVNNLENIVYISSDTNYVELKDLSDGIPVYTISFESIYKTENRSYPLIISFDTIDTDLNKYNTSTELKVFSVTGNTITLDISKGQYYNSHDISYSSTILQTGKWSDNKYTIQNLVRDTSYTIGVKSYIDDISYIHKASIVQRTLNEGAVDISRVIVSDTSAIISWTNKTETEDISLSIINNLVYKYTYDLSNLTPNTQYSYSYNTKYTSSKNTYTKYLYFTTLNEYPPDISATTYFNTALSGNTTIIEVNYTNQRAVKETTINIGGNSYQTAILDFSMISQYQNYSGNVVTKYKDTPSSGYVSYQTKQYTTDFSFSATMYKPIYTVSSHDISMDWYDNQTASYNIIIDNSNIVVDQKNKHVDDLSANTSFDISLKRTYSNRSSPDSTTSQIIKTLNQGSSFVTGDSIIESWGLGGLNVVLDISNINQTDVSCTFLNYRRQTDTGNYTPLKNTETTIFDLGVVPDVSYDFFATTVYKPLTSELKNVKYTSGSYDSNIFSFKTNRPNAYTKSNVGNWQDLPSGWTLTSAIISGNDPSSNSTDIRTKYLKPDISNIILYKTENKSSVASVKRHIDYLLKDYYTISYYVANHVTEGFLFSYRQADRDIEYQLQLKIISNMKEVVLWETTNIVSADVCWNKVEIKFYLPKSTKDVTFSLERTQFEFNNLFISDVSIVGNGESFPTTPFFSLYDDASYNKSLWNTPRQTRYKQWKEIMPYDDSSSRKVFTLATNMTIGFWLYVHDIPDDNKEKGIFILGSALETGCPTISINEETLYVKNKGNVLIQKQHALTKKIPVYFSITFDQKKVSLYKNGEVSDISYQTSYLSEADWEGNIYFGTPSVPTYGYIMGDIEMQKFPLSDTQVSYSYNNTKTQYSSIGNYSDISGNVIISHDIVMVGYINTWFVPIYFSLNNQKTLRKTIKTYGLSFSTGSNIGNVSLSLPSSLPPSLSLAFWGNSLPTGNIFDFNNNGVSRFKLIVGNSSIYTNINTSLKIPTKADLQHFSWTFNGYTGESKSYLNGYLYDISFNTTRSLDLSINSFSRSSSTSGSIGEFQIYNKVLSQSEILTAYYNHYSLDYTYDLSGGLYRVRLHVPPDSGNTLVSYHIYGNNYNLNTVGGSISANSSISSSYIDISMSPTDLNNFNRNVDLSFNFVLSDYNIITQVKPTITSPYISVDVSGRSNVLTASQISINESDTLYMKLNNALSDVSYSYLISGIDNSQIQGNVLSGNIQFNQTLPIMMRQDYKTQKITNNNMVFSIANLGLAVSFILTDSTTNMLTTDLSFAVKDQPFTIRLDIPTTNPVLYFPYKITGNTFVSPNNSTGVFRRTNTDISSIDISFQVITQSSEKFILSLDDNDSEVIVILNDIEVPTLDVSGGLDNYQVDEGKIVDLTIKTPQSWEDTRAVYFYIYKTNTEITKEDISLDSSYKNDGSYNYTDMSGYFSIKSARATMRFKILPNKPYSEGTETIKFILSDYRDVSASIVIIDTEKPPSYSWIITDTSDNIITQINEGGTFKFTLVTAGVDSKKDISYNITGITRDSISSGDTSLSGVFRGVDSPMSRTITIGKDLTTTGNKTFVVSTNLGDLNILDQYASIIINDTSQSPNITISSTVDRPRWGAYFSIIVAITNYNFLTDVQKGEQLHYKFYTGTLELEDTTNDITVISVPGTTANLATDGIVILRNGQYSAINSYMNHTFTFLCKTADQKTFTFLLGEEGGKSLNVILNKQ